MTDTEIDAAVDYANKAKLFPPKTAAQAFEAAWNAPSVQAAVSQSIDPEVVKPYPRQKRDEALITGARFTPEQVADKSVTGHTYVLERLQRISNEMRRCATRENSRWTYSLPEHRFVIALLKLEETLINEAALAEGSEPFSLEWKVA